jgi:hypothetical protein
MNGKPVLPTAPKLQIRKSIRMQAIVDFIKMIGVKKKAEKCGWFQPETSIIDPWETWDYSSIPVNSIVTVKYKNGMMIIMVMTENIFSPLYPLNDDTKQFMSTNVPDKMAIIGSVKTT